LAAAKDFFGHLAVAKRPNRQRPSPAKRPKANTAITHIQHCPGLIESWNNIRSNLDSFILTIWDSLSDDIDLPTRHKCSHLFLGNSQFSPQFTAFIASAMELKIEFSTFNVLKDSMKLPRSKIRNICTNILIHLVQLFRKNIWNERCSKVIQWERNNNISQRMKTAATHRKPRSPIRSVLHNTEDPEILDDPYIPPPIKPPIESKRDKFERIWNNSSTQINMLINKGLSLIWNFTQAKGIYMNSDCLTLTNDHF